MSEPQVSAAYDAGSIGIDAHCVNLNRKCSKFPSKVAQGRVATCRNWELKVSTVYCVGSWSECCPCIGQGWKEGARHQSLRELWNGFGENEYISILALCVESRMGRRVNIIHHLIPFEPSVRLDADIGRPEGRRHAELISSFAALKCGCARPRLHYVEKTKYYRKIPLLQPVRDQCAGRRFRGFTYLCYALGSTGNVWKSCQLLAGYNVSIRLLS